uniref:Uncharacterized protein n=1 Tax=Entomoneis paludosa TaxID=265537 RepID=A0A7S3DXD3_9STRA|mmetsp:Transcript_8663/g.18004  ORF Transcript_8663/g.18004 Transcript_8663/m.18004 type:complete len:789 (+) Transcript_8663:248-2614(+)|eukprot:CAMPEP_0172458466 /NCGR_PEP_ID=MMETSP1065-20121228/27673_1 /TAXON_ID=265537 /ORGANISM="Amphiprora paludosa, Strain CCMP125" /LENGTH=788 /DNA_ID=CAMNT_0013212735 /DNA_START=175 /DNA_END=2541 /DNA_ORIENTATION=-
MDSSSAEKSSNTGTDIGSSREIVMDEAVPEPQDVEAPSSAPRSGGYSSFTKWGIALASAGVIATSVSVPIALKNNSSSSSTADLNYTSPFEGAEEKLPLLSDDVLEGYQTKEEFMAAFELMAEAHLNGVVARNVGDQNYANFANMNVFVDEFEGDVVMMDSAAAPREQPLTGAASDGAEKVNDYDTNNQEEGVSEGDKAVSNGDVAIAAYGDSIVGWKVSDGTELLRMELEPTTGYSKPRVNTLMLQGNLLIAAVGGYGYAAQQETPRVLSAYKGTRILVYDISNIGQDKTSLELLAQRDVNGDFVTIRAIGDQIYFVLNSQINLYHFLVDPFERYRNPELESLDADAYSNKVREMAQATTIPEFVQRATDEILECGEMPRLVALNRWTTDEQSDPSMEHFLYNQGIAQSMVMVVSFDLQELISENPEPLECLKVSGSFFPTSAWDVDVYAAPDTMIMAIRGYDFSATRQMSIDSTYMVAFDLTADSVVPKAYGNVEGYVLDQYSFRVEGNVLEMATTIREQWMWILAEPVGLRHLQEGRPIIQNIPATENYVITMALDGAERQMQELDRLKLGKEGEVFTTVRFYPDLAYAVTFRQMDPFYVLNTEDPNNLVIDGILDNITGWSSYLEPMNDANTEMLAIGQEANQWGGALGLSIAVFDAKNLTDVKMSARHIVESSTEVWSDSEGLRNKNAIRFNAPSGRLILPLSLGSNQGNYRGFRVYAVETESITEVKGCGIDLSDTYDVYGYSSRSLEPRSMIIDGRFMAMMGDTVVMKDLFSCQEYWRLPL